MKLAQLILKAFSLYRSNKIAILAHIWCIALLQYFPGKKGNITPKNSNL